ncbi:MAG: hypothetical protein GY839_09050 [candidate division Zixibacteria bacterium]|nr:hypothetical protein [candidate division Zixibacteria bacterium]
MTGQINNIEELMRARLREYQELQSILENAIGNKQGTIWGLDQIGEISSRFADLRKLDELQEKIGLNQDVLIQDKNLILLIRDLKNRMCVVKQLLITFQIKLEGAKQIMSSKMKNVVKGMEIKGYKTSTEFDSGSNICIC